MAELNYQDLQQLFANIKGGFEALDAISTSFATIAKCQETLVELEIMKASGMFGVKNLAQQDVAEKRLAKIREELNVRE